MALLTDWRNFRRRAGIGAVASVVVLSLVAAPVHAAVNGKHALLIVDGNTGRTLSQSAADDLRYPASLTKLMTLYLIFELIEQGRLSYRSKIRFSANAVAAAPTKLDVEEGTEISLMDAIKALITKSCNDVAIAVAEHIAGTEARFAAMMTQKARDLGMTSSVFRNASGLPDPEQVTTARDMITLALRLQDDFPQHYPLFATRTFTYDGETYRNHNTLLFSYEGTDGLKTGYTRASGFNLVTSVRRGRKHVVGAVFGGATASLRNATMRTYLNMGLMRASNEKTRRPAPRLIASPKTAPQTIVAPAPQPAQRPVAQVRGPAIDIARVRPVLVPGAAATQTVGAHAAPDSIEALLARYPAVQASHPVTTASTAERQMAAGGFHVQIGAYTSQSEAERQLTAVRERAGTLLANRAGVTSEFRKQGKVFYRARYGGFEAQGTAAGVCSALKRLNVGCLVMAAE